MEKLLPPFKAIFAELDETKFVETLHLGEIPGWDSMNSINLLMELETQLGGDYGNLQLTGEMSLGELAAALRSRGAEL
jgi:acyl carrier protein